MSLSSFKNILVALIMVTGLMAKVPKSPVTFTAPPSWGVLESKEQNGADVTLYKICENKIPGGLQTPSNAMISVYKVPNSLSIKDADAIVASHVRNAKLIVSGKDGDNWKTYIYVIYEQNHQLIILYRIGIFNNFAAEAMICFPHNSPKDAKSFKVLTITESTVKPGEMAGVYCVPSSVSEMVKQFNQLCATLKIAGVNTFVSRAELLDPPSGATYYRKTEEKK